MGSTKLTCTKRLTCRAGLASGGKHLDVRVFVWVVPRCKQGKGSKCLWIAWCIPIMLGVAGMEESTSELLVYGDEEVPMTMSTVLRTACQSFWALPRMQRVQPLLRLPRIS